MVFRFDMQGKTPQQQIMVAKRDAEAKRRQQEDDKKDVKSKISHDVKPPNLTLAIDKDTCPAQDNIIMKQQCSGCKYYKAFKLYEGQPCVECLYE